MNPKAWLMLIPLAYTIVLVLRASRYDRKTRRRQILGDIERERRWNADKDLTTPQLRQRIQSSLKCYSARWEKRYIEETLDELLGCSSVLPIEEDELLKKYL